MKKFSNILITLALFALSGVASAVPIGGTIEFDGGFTTDTGDQLTATKFTFINDIDVTAATESFLPLSGGAVTYKVLDVNALPVAPLWEATVGSITYSFDLNNITVDAVAFDSFRLIKGTGLFTIGTDTAFGTWEFSTQGAGSAGTFSFSASQASVPATFILMGLGLIGMGAARKLRKR